MSYQTYMTFVCKLVVTRRDHKFCGEDNRKADNPTPAKETFPSLQTTPARA